MEATYILVMLITLVRKKLIATYVLVIYQLYS